jgi:hypothetical protein
MAYVNLLYGTYRSGTSMVVEALIAGGQIAVSVGPPHFEPSAPLNPESHQGYLLKPIQTPPEAFPPWPDGYKIVFMRRDPYEIAASRQAAFNYPGDAAHVQHVVDHRLSVLKSRADCEVLELWYDYVLEDPEAALRIVANFFAVDIDLAAAAAIVDPEKRTFRMINGELQSR